MIRETGKFGLRGTWIWRDSLEANGEVVVQKGVPKEKPKRLHWHKMLWL